MTGAPCCADTPPDSPVNEALHDVAHMPDFPKMSLCSGWQREPGGVVDDLLDVAFSAGLLGGIQLLRMPDPRSVQEAMASPDAEGWCDAMDREMENIRLHNMYELVPHACDTQSIHLRWVLHCKFKNGTFDRNKARLVARGNHQWLGIDYGESFAPVMRLESLCTLLALAASQDFDIIQFDITSAYLHGTLKEEVYVEQPDGYASPGKEGWVWQLKKGLYSLVQAGCTWNEELDGHMGGVGYTATAKDAAVYVKNSWESNNFIAGGYWVDDFVGVGSRSEPDTLAESVDQKYGITGLGDVKWLLGMLIECDRANRWIYILQEAFINTVLARFNLTNAVPLSIPMIPGSRLSSADCPTLPEEKVKMADRPYRQLVGAISWLALSTRPDIAFTTASLARFGHNPGCVHWEAAKRVLRYLKGTIGWRLRLGGSEPVVAAFTDADWGGDLDDRRSIGAYVLKGGDGVVSWKSKKQTCVALSSTEAEYVALCQVSKEAEWMLDFLKGLGIPMDSAMVVHVDNQGAIALANNPVFLDHLKHIGIQYHYTRLLVKSGLLDLQYLPTKEMLAAILTKPLPHMQHQYLARRIGVF